MTFQRRPLVRRAPDGRPYIAASDVLPRPRYTAAVKPAQLASAPAATSEPAAKSKYANRLTDADADAIRADYATGRWTQADLAYIYSVSKNAISQIVRGLNHARAKTQPPEQES